jgi:hypothetical protein
MATRYTVVSTQHADDQLLTLWMNASPADRAAITRASHAIDAALRDDPDQKGVSLDTISPGLRLLDEPPLRAYFEVSEPDRLIWIVDFEILPAIP